MNKLKYFNKIVIISISLILLTGCGKKAEQAQTSSANTTSANETVAKNNEVKMDIALKKKLDIFFSNFSEAYVKPFEKDKIDDSSLISFGEKHIIINNKKGKK